MVSAEPRPEKTVCASATIPVDARGWWRRPAGEAHARAWICRWSDDGGGGRSGRPGLRPGGDDEGSPGSQYESRAAAYILPVERKIAEGDALELRIAALEEITNRNGRGV